MKTLRLEDAINNNLPLGESDEACLDIASAVRTSLVYLVGEVAERKRNAREYESKIASVMEKVHKKGQKKTDVK